MLSSSPPTSCLQAPGQAQKRHYQTSTGTAFAMEGSPSGLLSCSLSTLFPQGWCLSLRPAFFEARKSEESPVRPVQMFIQSSPDPGTASAFGDSPSTDPGPTSYMARAHQPSRSLNTFHYPHFIQLHHRLRYPTSTY